MNSKEEATVVDEKQASRQRQESRSNGNARYAVVATIQYLLLVDLTTKQVVPLEMHRPEYYGISWFRNSASLVLSHSRIDNASLLDLPSYVHSEVGVISFGGCESSPFLSAPHQILCAPDGRVICTNTGRNAITVVDPQQPTSFQEFRLSAHRWDRLALNDILGDHLNSVFLRDEHLYVIAHGHRSGSKLAILSYPELQIHTIVPIKNRTGLHNIWVTTDGQRFSCDSEQGAVVELDANEAIWLSGSNAFTRGIAASADIVLIGESENTARGQRKQSISSLWVVDRSTWKTLDYICLGPFGVVHEVRILDTPDDAHHGHIFTGIDKLLSRTPYTEITRKKLHANGLREVQAEKWKNWETVFGSPTFDEQCGKTASESGLCLIVQNEEVSATSKEVCIRYSFNQNQRGSHVSIVSYRGVQHDSEMLALLLQPISEFHCSLRLWVHDGKEWSLQSEVKIEELPLTAKICVRLTIATVQICVDDLLILEISSELVPFSSGKLGVRWLGATIFPA